MRALALVLLAAVELGGVFGSASADARPLDASTMEVELRVEAPGGNSVVAHLLSPGEEERVVAMAEVEPGRYLATAETRRADLAVVFEVVGSAQSEPVSFSRLGIDPALLGRGAPPSTVAEPSRGTERWGWLGLAAGAGALALLAVWVVVGDDRSRPEPDAEPVQSE